MLKIKCCNKKYCNNSPEIFWKTSDNLCTENYQNMYPYMPLGSRKIPLWSREIWLFTKRKVLLWADLRTRGFADALSWIPDKESLSCDFRKPCWGRSEHPSLSPWWKTENIQLQLNLKEEEISLCLLLLSKLVNLKCEMRFFLLSNWAQGCWRLFPSICHILHLSINNYRMH